MLIEVGEYCFKTPVVKVAHMRVTEWMRCCLIMMALAPGGMKTTKTITTENEILYLPNIIFPLTIEVRSVV